MSFKNVGTYDLGFTAPKNAGGAGAMATLDAAGIASGQAFLVSELEKRDTMVREPLTSFTYPRDIGIDVGGGWAEFVSAMQVGYGITGGSGDGMVHAGGSNGIPMIQANFDKGLFKTHVVSAGTRVMWIDIQRGNMTGRNIDSLLRDGLRMAYDKHVDENVYVGIKRYGTTGLLNNPDVAVTEAAGTGAEKSTKLKDKTPDQILDAFAAELLAASPRSSLSTPASYTYGDESGMAVASGTLGAEKRDFNGDGMQELLVISIRNGQLVLDTYTAAGGAASMVSSVAFEECFGKAVEGVTYGGTQTCFIRENGAGFDIGMAGYYFGMNTGDGNPGAKTVAALYTMGADGSLNMSASASLINGTISSPQEGGKDGFISALSSAGMSGSWVSESADMLAGMDLANNPVQDMAGVPNPLGGGLAGKEPGVQDLVVVNAGMQPGSGSMNFSVTDNTTCGK